MLEALPAVAAFFERLVAARCTGEHARRHVLDVVLGVGMKTLSNYTNHLAHTPLDPAWQGQEWSREPAGA